MRATLVIAVTAGAAQSAQAHGIAGNRFFPGTITFDDPAVADELQLFSIDARHDLDGATTPATPAVRDRAFYGSFQRLLVEDLAIGINGGGIWRTGGGLSPRAGFDQTSLSLKQQVYRDDLGETLVAASLTWSIGGTGSRAVGAGGLNTLAPAVTFGQGFGALPEALAWLRPFGVGGAVSLEVPLDRARSSRFGTDATATSGTTGQIGTVVGANVTTLHWGLAVEYSTLYLTDRFTPGVLPKDEPLHQLVPLVEFAFDTPWRGRTAATANPGLAYVEDVWQVSAEAILPLNRAGGRGPGFRAQVLIFLDDFAPSLFGKPLLTR